MSRDALARRLGTADAVLIGLGSMIGAGVFAAFAPAAEAAGVWLMAGLALAALVAFCNATSSAQLAAQYPSAGGSYLYGRERLGEWWGYLAGWGFVVGKTASLAAMALTFAAYAVPPPWQRPAALAAVVVLAGVNLRGITRTAQLTRLIVAVVLTSLVTGVVTSLVGAHPDLAMLSTSGPPDGLYGVLQSGALLFFAFAGYARIATLAEEVRDPQHTIPRAITIALLVVVAIYAVVGVTVLSVLGPTGTATAAAPLASAAQATGWSWPELVVRAGAAIASLGSLLALLAGVGRTALAMGRHWDLPPWFAAVHPRFRVPHHAEVAVAVAVSAMVVTVDIRGAIGFSAFGVLLYYFVTNVAACTQEAGHRRYPRPVQVLGASGCVLLGLAVPVGALLAGAVVLAVGVVVRLGRGRHAG